jgi:hypothetical protein
MAGPAPDPKEEQARHGISRCRRLWDQSNDIVISGQCSGGRKLDQVVFIGDTALKVRERRIPPRNRRRVIQIDVTIIVVVASTGNASRFP